MPIAVGVSIVCFALIHLAPGDPLSAVIPEGASREAVAQIKQAYGFDRPLPIQYAMWLGRVLQVDFGVLADDVAVMYAGRFVETGTALGVIEAPRHPFTLGLLRSTVHGGTRGQPLDPIPGAPPDLVDLPPGCAFEPRCAVREGRCHGAMPGLAAVAPDHLVRCVRTDERGVAGNLQPSVTTTGSDRFGH